MSEPLIIPRRLAIALLAEAQRSTGAPVHGVIGARDGVPLAVLPGASDAPAGQSVWAHYRSGDEAPAVTGRRLRVSLDTKGVLQLRCEETVGTAVVERELRII